MLARPELTHATFTPGGSLPTGYPLQTLPVIALIQFKDAEAVDGFENRLFGSGVVTGQETDGYTL
jgi:hypothetical protein